MADWCFKMGDLVVKVADSDYQEEKLYVGWTLLNIVMKMIIVLTLNIVVNCYLHAPWFVSCQSSNSMDIYFLGALATPWNKCAKGALCTHTGINCSIFWMKLPYILNIIQTSSHIAVWYLDTGELVKYCMTVCKIMALPSRLNYENALITVLFPGWIYTIPKLCYSECIKC